MADKKKVPLTGANTHVATAHGYHGRVFSPGEMVPEGIAVADDEEENGWMKPVKKGDRELLAATNAGLEPHPADQPLEDLSKPALEAMAAERGIPVGGLSKEDLITAIKAAYAQTA